MIIILVSPGYDILIQIIVHLIQTVVRYQNETEHHIILPDVPMPAVSQCVAPRLSARQPSTGRSVPVRTATRGTLTISAPR